MFTFVGIWLLDMLSNLHLEISEYEVTTILLWASGLVGVGMSLLYFASRMFLLVEIFRNLAFLDPTVYKTPNVRKQSAILRSTFICFGEFACACKIGEL